MDSSLFFLISEFRGWRIYLPLLAGEVASHRSESRGAELPHILPPVCRRPGGTTQTTETSLTRSVPCKCCQYSHWSCLPFIEWKTFFWNLHVIFKMNNVSRKAIFDVKRPLLFVLVHHGFLWTSNERELIFLLRFYFDWHVELLLGHCHFLIPHCSVVIYVCSTVTLFAVVFKQGMYTVLLYSRKRQETRTRQKKSDGR